MRKEPNLSDEDKLLRDDLYRAQRNKVSVMTRRARRDFVARSIESAQGNQNRLWQIVRYVLKNEFKNTRNALPPELVLSTGEVIQEPDKVIEELNRHFTDVSVELKEALLIDNSQRPRQFTLLRTVDSSVYARPTNENEVFKILSNLNVKAAAGVDGISSKFLKSLGPLFLSAVTSGINLSLRSGEFPSSFKDVRLTALFKGGESNLSMNYRPLSVIPNPSKVLENVVYSRMWEFATSNELIDPNQFGFMKGSNTMAAVLTLTQRCIESIESKLFTSIIFIDVKKAFDCVDHELLLRKLHQLGYRGQVYVLLQQYLFARRQRVQVGDKKVAIDT